MRILVANFALKVLFFRMYIDFMISFLLFLVRKYHEPLES